MPDATQVHGYPTDADIAAPDEISNPDTGGQWWGCPTDADVR